MLFSLFFNEGLIVRRLCPLMIGLASAGDLPPWLLKRQHFCLFRTTFLGPPCFLLTVSLGASPRSFLRAAVFQAERSALSLRVCCDNLMDLVPSLKCVRSPFLS